MKALIASLVLFASLKVSVAQKKPNLDDTKVLNAIIAVSVDESDLRKRDRKGEKLAFVGISQTPFTGWWRIMHDNGQIYSLGQYKDGKRDGLETRWYSNERKQEECTYKDGKLDGLLTWWYYNGQKMTRRTYKNGKIVTAVRWKPNGEKCPVTNVVNGNGVMVAYRDDGTEDFRTTYKDGKVVTD